MRAHGCPCSDCRGTKLRQHGSAWAPSAVSPRSPLRIVLGEYLSAFTHSVCVLCVYKMGRFYFSEVLSQAFSMLNSRQDTQEAQLSVFTVNGCVVFHVVGAPASQLLVSWCACAFRIFLFS